MIKIARPVLMAASAFALAGATYAPAHAAPVSITKSSFGTLSNGTPVSLYTLTNARGMKVKITNYGGIVTSIMVPDRRGKYGDVVLGYDNVQGYVKGSPYFGALVGRFANRIAKGRFKLNNTTYKLATNNGPNHLHGGLVGFDKKVWAATPLKTRNSVGLSLRLFSANGEEGYPGNLNVHATYTLTNDNALHIMYSAVTDQDTVINLTNHSYFNLAGAGNGTILNHRMMLNANKFVPIDKTSIPLGPLESVKGTPFNFLRPIAIGARINNNNTQLKNGAGYDHNYVINGRMGTLRMAARVAEPTTGRVLIAYTTEPGMQLYTGNFLDGTNIGKGGKKYIKRGAFCLEAQHYPDSPNQPQFPTSELKPGQVYHQTTVYRFSTTR